MALPDVYVCVGGAGGGAGYPRAHPRHTGDSGDDVIGHRASVDTGVRSGGVSKKGRAKGKQNGEGARARLGLASCAVCTGSNRQVGLA